MIELATQTCSNVQNMYGQFLKIKKMSGMCTEFFEGSFFHTKKMSEMCTEFLKGSFFIQKMSGMCTETSLNINFDLF